MSTKKKAVSKPKKEFICVLKGEGPNDYAIHCADEADFRKQLDENGDSYDLVEPEVYEVYTLAGEITVKPSTVVVEGWQNVSW